jgi:hypothetical protein
MSFTKKWRSPAKHAKMFSTFAGNAFILYLPSFSSLTASRTALSHDLQDYIYEGLVFGDEPHQPPSELLQLLCEEYYNTLYIDVRRARYY